MSKISLHPCGLIIFDIVPDQLETQQVKERGELDEINKTLHPCGLILTDIVPDQLKNTTS